MENPTLLTYRLRAAVSVGKPEQQLKAQYIAGLISFKDYQIAQSKLRSK